MTGTNKGQIRVGVDATSWANDRGFGRFTRELMTALAKRESRFHYTLIFDREPDFDLPENVDVVCAGTGRTLNEAAVGDQSRSIGYLLRMGAAVRKGKFDVFFFPAVYSYFPLLARVPRVICYHDTTAERIPHLLFPTKMNHRLWQLKTLLAKWQTTRAMTISQSSARDLENILKIPKTKIDLVTEGADPVFRMIGAEDNFVAARNKHNIPQDAELLMCVGGMNAHKNILGFLEAMVSFTEKLPNVHLVIVGDTSGKGFWDNVPELMQFVEDNPPLSERVHFTGYIPDEELVHLFSGAAALVFPSLWEGFGLPAVEAMACGLPVLASDRGSLPEVVGPAGLFYDPESITEIEAQVLKFFSEPELRAALVEAAPKQAATFSWEEGGCDGRAMLPELFVTSHLTGWIISEPARLAATYQSD